MSEREWVGAVVVSPLDRSVWVAVLPDQDAYTGAMHASTSRRKCQRHVTDSVSRDLGVEATDIEWVLDGDRRSWDAYLRPASP